MEIAELDFRWLCENVNANRTSSNGKKLLWAVTAVFIGALAALNPFYTPDISLPVGIAAWFADMALILILSVNPITARLGILAAGLFLAVPCFLWASSLARGLLMCCMAFPLTIATAPLFAPPTSNFRARLGWFFSWMGTGKIERRVRSFDVLSLLHLIAATAVFAFAVFCVKSVSAVGFWLLMRWLAGGIMILAFAEIATSSHDLLTNLMGINAPALMRSPILSASIGEFWARRWNVAASALIFRPIFFKPFVRRGVALGLFAAFFFSGFAHVLLAFMAMGRWKMSFVCGAFFAVQPLLILAERKMKVRCWPTAAARTWALAALAITSPLFVEPVIQLVTPSLRLIDNVLWLTVAMLGFAVVVNLFFSVGQLMSCPKAATSKVF